MDVDGFRRSLWRADSVMNGKFPAAGADAVMIAERIRPRISRGAGRAAQVASCRLVRPLQDIAIGGPRCAAVPRRSLLAASGGFLLAFGEEEWALTGSNRRPTACKAAALPLS
jgi:hypothetical protein